MKDPLVSIVVPIYNGEKYVKDCITALQNQTYKNIEIILVNDGSKDKSATILDDIKSTDNRIYVIHKENGGVSSARNAGLDAANGKYIMFCDCDDIPEANWCEELFKCAELYPDRLPICGIKMDTDVNTELCDMHMDGVDSDVLYIPYDRKAVFHIFKSNLLNAPYNKIYSLNTIKTNDLSFDTQESMGEDLLFNLQYFSCMESKTVYVNKLLYTYIRQNAESLSCKAVEKDSRFLDKEYENFRSILLPGNEDTFDEMNKYYFYRYMDLIFGITSDKKRKKSDRCRAISRIIDSAMFERCTSDVNEKIIKNVKALNLARNRLKLKAYVFVKIVFA